MSQHEGFLHAIIETPDDDAPRLIYADWLEENGNPARADFIRVQCRLAVLDTDAPEFCSLQRREYELLAEHWGEWAGPIIGRVRGWQFRRGFIAHVKVSAEQFLKVAKGLLDFAPIDDVYITHPDSDEVRALAASRDLRRIRRLYLDHAKFGDADVALIAESTNVDRLTHLSLKFVEMGTTGLLALTKSLRLKTLRSLDFGAIDFDDSAFVAFAANCQLPSLECLVWNSKVGPEGIRALLSSPLAGRLAALSLRNSHLGAEGFRLLAWSPVFARLKELDVDGRDGDDLSGAGAHLADSPLLRGLKSLSLSPMELGDEGAAALARTTQTGALRHLDLSHNRITSAGAKALSESRLCDSLTRLDLAGNLIGDRGLKALVASPHLNQLRCLDLYKCDLTQQAAKALLKSPHLDRLTILGLQENNIGRKAFDELRERLGDRLYHEYFDAGLDGNEIIRRVKAEPPRCLRGLGARTETELLRRFPRERLDPREYASIAFELTHPDLAQKPVLLGYEDTRGYDIFFSPYAIRWEPSGEQREFFDAEQHGRAAEWGGNCTIVGSGKRKPWKCGRRGCRSHAFLVTFIYRIEYPPSRFRGRHLPFADQFYHFDLDAYCASQDRVIEIASFECK